MAYTPYRVLGECPTAEEAEEDIRILMQHTKRVRTYTTLCVSVNRVLMRYADEGSLSVIFGVWIDNVEMDSMELQHLYDVLKEYPHANIEGIAIGNEVAFRGSMSTEQVANVVKNTRKEVLSKRAACFYERLRFEAWGKNFRVICLRMFLSLQSISFQRKN